MVDRIKFSVDNASLGPDILEKMFYPGRKKKNGNTVYQYQNNYVNDEDDDDTEKLKYQRYLFIQYKVYADPKPLPGNSYLTRNELIIHTNLRKDQFGQGTVKDLRFIDFEEVIRKKVGKFGISEKMFWNARVTKLELGVTLQLKSKMKGFLSCLDNFNGITHKNIYGDDGISYVGENYSVSLYNKLEKMWKNKELFPNTSNKKKSKEKVSRKNYLLRFELKIEKVSGFYRSSFRGKIDRLKDIRDNWNYLGKALLDLYADINYIDILSPEVEDTINGQELKPMDKFLKYQGIKAIGEDKFFNQILPLMKGGGTKFRKAYHNLINEYRKKYSLDYQVEFSEKLESRIQSLERKQRVD